MSEINVSVTIPSPINVSIIVGGSGCTDHAELENLEFANAGHTGFEPEGAGAAAVSTHESTYDHDNIPTADEKAALAGTGEPSVLNKYVTNDDPRLVPAIASQYRTLYMSNIATGIEDYLLLTADYSQLQVEAVTITTTTSTVDELIGSWTTGVFGQGYRVIPQGVWKYFFRGRVQTTSGKKDAAVIAKLYKRNSIGEETFLLESLTSPVLTDVFVFLKVEVPVDELDLQDDEILVGKLYARSSGTGGEPRVEYQYTDQTGTRIEVPSTGIVRHSDTTDRDEAGSHPSSAVVVDTPFTPSNSAIAAGDTSLVALQKAQGQINAFGETLPTVIPYRATFVIADWQTSGVSKIISIPASTHAQVSKYLHVGVYQNGTPNEYVVSGHLIAESGDVTLVSDSAFDGYVVISDLRKGTTTTPTSTVYKIIESDFTTIVAATGLQGTAMSAGIAQASTGTKEHIGVVALRDSTSANGGYRFMTDIRALLVGGGEKSVFIFQSTNVRSTASFRLGFQNSTAIQTQPTDGIWFQSVSNGSSVSILGRCSAVGSVTDTTNSYELTQSTWYTGIIQINSDATLATFSIYNDAGTLLWSNTVATNIPKTTGQETGWGIIAGETTTDAAAAIMVIDYMKLEIDRTLIRVTE